MSRNASQQAGMRSSRSPLPVRRCYSISTIGRRARLGTTKSGSRLIRDAWLPAFDLELSCGLADEAKVEKARRRRYLVFGDAEHVRAQFQLEGLILVRDD